MRLKILIASSALLAALLPFHSSDPAAGTAVRMDIETLVGTADLVLEGRVLATRTTEDAQGRITTDYEMEVDRTFTGEHRERRTLRMPGGVLESGRGLMIPGLPTLQTGENVIMALSEPSSKGVRLPTGLSQGKFRVLPGINGIPMAIRGGVGGSLIGPNGIDEEGGQEAITYVELVSRIEAASNAKASEAGR